MNDTEQTGTTPEANALETAARMPLVGARLVDDAPRVVSESGVEQAREDVLALPEGVPVNYAEFMESRWQYNESVLQDGTAWIVLEGDAARFAPGVMVLNKGLAALIVDEHNQGLIELGGDA